MELPPRRVVFEGLLLVVGLVLTIQYAWLMDDAFVYFRYADNLLYAGRGLVYNSGEYVEGYSSPLWMLLVLVVRAAGLDWWLAVRLLGVLSCIVFWALLVRVGRDVSPRGVTPIHLPLLLMVPNYAVLCYFTSGLESPLVQVMAAVFALTVLRPDSRWLQLVAGLAPLVRHELALPLAFLALWCVVRTRRLPWILLLSSSLTLGAWLGFRVWYYADLLPNTFYLKDEWMPQQGLVYLLDTLKTYGLHFVLGSVAVAFSLLWVRDRRFQARGIGMPSLRLPERCVMLLMAAGVTAYVIKIGGDPRHYRYLAFPICLALAASAGLPEHLLYRLGWRLPRLLGVGLGLVLMGGVASLYPRQLARHPLLGPAVGEPLTRNQVGTSGKQPFHQTVDLINDAAVHRHHADLSCPPWGSCAKVDERALYQAIGAAPGESSHRGVSVGYWCAKIYHDANERAVHSLGLTEPFLARTQMAADRPAHKYGLVPLARDLQRLLLAARNQPHVGMFRAAVEAGRAPAWVHANLKTLETIERKVYNRHDFFENLQLALSLPEKIDPRRLPGR